jgi:putative phosphoesterase
MGNCAKFVYTIDMKIGVISDTHDKHSNIDTALKFFSEHGVSEVVHCGDWKLVSSALHYIDVAQQFGIHTRGVLGNNDIEVASFLELNKTNLKTIHLVEGVLEFTVNDTKIVAYHGHHAPTLRDTRNRTDYDFLLLGHTHKPVVDSNDNRLIVNPGSTAFSIPRSKVWVPTVAIIDTTSRSATIYMI